MALDFDVAVMLRAVLHEQAQAEQAQAEPAKGGGAAGAVIDLEDLPSGMKF